MRQTLIAFTLLAACNHGKTTPTDDFANLDGVDTKSDSFSTHLKLLGSLDYGQTSAVSKYTSSPKYRAYKFGGNKGDQVDVWVRSPDGSGDSVAWVVDNNFKTLASNDDADNTTLDSHITLTLPGNKNASIITYYIIYRDYWLDSAKFQVTLSGSPDFYSCKVDSDCAKVPKACCTNLGNIAVNTSSTTAYQDSLNCSAHQICPLIMYVDDHSAPECVSNKCTLVKPADIACGGFIANSHSCPDGYSCVRAGFIADVPGKCYQSCGGIAGIACSDSSLTCVDNPSDSCDPTTGGADCGGICQ